MQAIGQAILKQSLYQYKKRGYLKMKVICPNCDNEVEPWQYP